MKKIFFLIGSAVLGILPLPAAQPVPESCTLGDRPFTRPLDEIGFFFDGGIKLLEGATATVTCDGEVVATATRMEVSNYVSTRTQGALAIFFDGQLLPKGKTYTVSVAPGSIACEAGGEPNARFTRDFTVPANLGPGYFDCEDGTVIAQTSRSGGLPWCYWGIETEAAGEPYFILYRENTPVREFPASIGWDWDLGQAYPMTDEELHFENGVRYSLVLPEGSAHAMYREDIVNEELVFNFMGGYEEPLAPLNYVWCSLFTDHSDVLGIVSFTYDRPVRLSEGAALQLWECDGNTLVKEVTAYLDPQSEGRTVSADFGGFQMAPGVCYTFVIPEGSVIAADGDPVVNLRNAFALDGTSGLGTINVETAGSPVYDLSGRETTTLLPGNIYISNGRKFTVR